MIMLLVIMPIIAAVAAPEIHRRPWLVRGLAYYAMGHVFPLFMPGWPLLKGRAKSKGLGARLAIYAAFSLAVWVPIFVLISA